MSDIKLKVKVLTPILPLPQRGVEVLARLLREFYAIPENLAGFEKWQKERELNKNDGELVEGQRKKPLVRQTLTARVKKDLKNYTSR